MILTHFSTNRIIIYIYAALLIIFGSLQTNIYDPNIKYISLIVLIIYFLQFWNELSTNAIAKWRFTIIYVLLVTCLVISVFSFDVQNPYSVFSYSFIRSIFLISIPLFLLWTQGEEIKQQKVLFLLPLLLLILLNSYFVIFDFTELVNSDRARHCYNVFAIYDLLTGQDGSKLLLSLTYYDFYQPLVYLVSVPFIMIFGKSYTAATLSLPLFWLPLGYISLFKFFRKITLLDVGFASVFSFAIMGSVISTSLTKQLMLDFPALCMVCFYNYRLAKSGYLSNTNQSFIAGLIFGLGILTKSNFLMLALIPLIFSIVTLLIKSIKNEFEFKNLFFNTLLHIAGMILGGGFWYLLNNDHYSFVLQNVTTLAGQNEGDPNPASLASILWYPIKFLYYFTPVICLILMFGVFYSFKYLKYQKDLILMAYGSIILTYIISTMTWNKDARTLLPLIFYFFPAFLGLTYIKNSLIKNILIGLILIITFLINISFINGNKLKLANRITSGPYTLPWEPTPPTTVNIKQSYYVYNKLYKERFGDINPPKLHIENYDEAYTNDMYLSQYPIKYKLPLLDTSSGYTIIFFRNRSFPDYYLYKIKSHDGNLYVQKIGEHKYIGGDTKIYIKEGYADIREIDINNLGTEMIIPIDKNAKTLKLAMAEFHSWPSSSLIKLLAKVTGNAQYSWAGQSTNLPIK